MGEELAHKLQTEQRHEDLPVEEVDEELLMVMKLSLEEAKQKEAFENEISKPDKETQAVISQTVEDEDYQLALRMQAEFESENLARRLAEEERLVIDPHSKVTATWDASYQPKYRGPSYYTQEYDGLDSESDEESEEEFENPVTVKPHHSSVKTNGRVAAKEIITKHDPTIDGHKNAASVERMMDSGNMKNVKLSNRVFNSLVQDSRKQQGHTNRVRGNKLDKSTSEQVLDQRTRVLLLKMINTELLADVHGIISTGKEANVYHAVAGVHEKQAGEEYAVKIFKTTLNEFKNRSDYVEGEFRFRRASLQNPRKLIKLWAEKEMRNLKRISAAGVPCPTPIVQRENILVMSFIGKDGFPAPCLKDAPLSHSKMKHSYYAVSYTHLTLPTT
eukprot:TRINITY_DN940_c0_g1_i1.p1 TRINITY_DN940_c0_g1~~TRINITY_DN940_c0_g1_i1.p1  ORF type:complete len:412 (+),score=122.21 TRINITY_DN940_c0_g1_i1:72-1238(+)